jgi:hypothetical protein
VIIVTTKKRNLNTQRQIIEKVMKAQTTQIIQRMKAQITQIIQRQKIVILKKTIKVGYSLL